jgi:hypothetical protein
MVCFGERQLTMFWPPLHSKCAKNIIRYHHNQAALACAKHGAGQRRDYVNVK